LPVPEKCLCLSGQRGLKKNEKILDKGKIGGVYFSRNVEIADIKSVVKKTRQRLGE
jgi:hypothetical protein